ncbi:dapper homolog 3 isoform X1 [Erinaceus europaeus]|uniref:Dapper homolog 3 isoform X1 n=1 Tax=Erinaceus europaeus TaxID=9365 RepID=A0ABM3WZU8_ERIEU|nr:dapper homolog 3 isoform X1 [Erinaceus europaeus]
MIRAFSFPVSPERGRLRGWLEGSLAGLCELHWLRERQEYRVQQALRLAQPGMGGAEAEDEEDADEDEDAAAARRAAAALEEQLEALPGLIWDLGQQLGDLSLESGGLEQESGRSSGFYEDPSSTGGPDSPPSTFCGDSAFSGSGSYGRLGPSEPRGIYASERPKSLDRREMEGGGGDREGKRKIDTCRPASPPVNRLPCRRRQSQRSGGGERPGRGAALLLGALPDGGSGVLLVGRAAAARGALPDAQPPARGGAAQPAALLPVAGGLDGRSGRGRGAAPGRLHLGASAQAPPPGGGAAPDESRGRGRGPAAPEQRAPAAPRRVPVPRRRAARARAPAGARRGSPRQPGRPRPRLGLAVGAGGGRRARSAARRVLAPRQPGRGPPGEGAVHPRRAGRHPRAPRPRRAPQGAAPPDARPQRGAVAAPRAAPGRRPPRPRDGNVGPAGLAQGAQGRALAVGDQPAGPRRRAPGAPQVPHGRARRAAAPQAPPRARTHPGGAGRGLLPSLALHRRDRRGRRTTCAPPRPVHARPRPRPVPVGPAAPPALRLRGQRLRVLGRAPGAPGTPRPGGRRGGRLRGERVERQRGRVARLQLRLQRLGRQRRPRVAAAAGGRVGPRGRGRGRGARGPRQGLREDQGFPRTQEEDPALPVGVTQGHDHSVSWGERPACRGCRPPSRPPSRLCHSRPRPVSEVSSVSKDPLPPSLPPFLLSSFRPSSSAASLTRKEPPTPPHPTPPHPRFPLSVLWVYCGVQKRGSL